MSSALEEVINARTVQRKEGTNTIPLVRGEDTALTGAQVIAPILMEGQPIGAVAIIARGDGTIGDTEQKAAEAAAAFLGRQMSQ